MVDFYGTPQKFNMEPEQKSLEKEIPFGKHHFSGSMLNFGGVNVGKYTYHIWILPWNVYNLQ